MQKPIYIYTHAEKCNKHVARNKMRHAKTHKYIYIVIFLFIDMQRTVTKMWLESKSGRGGWGEGAAPPPKAERQYLLSQAMLHAKTCLCIYIYTDAERCNKDVA